jgi:hypothetical protein
MNGDTSNRQAPRVRPAGDRPASDTASGPVTHLVAMVKWTEEMDGLLVQMLLAYGWKETMYGRCPGISPRCRQRRINALLNTTPPEVCCSTLDVGLCIIALEKKRGPLTRMVRITPPGKTR